MVNEKSGGDEVMNPFELLEEAREINDIRAENQGLTLEEKGERLAKFLDERYDKGIRVEQALISKKQRGNAFSVERDYVNSYAFRRKFERLPVNRDVQQVLYRHKRENPWL